MRVVFAGLFVFGGLLSAVAIIGYFGLTDSVPPIVFVILLFVLIAVAVILFNPKGTNLFGLKSPAQHLSELEKAGLLESAVFQATRAFGVEEFEDEGLHYFIELIDGRVLFLSGQYLYDYEPISDDPEVNQSRSFPCSEFTVRRHKTEGYVVDIICKGTIIEPEVMARPFGKRDWREGRVPKDGQVISDMPYGALMSSRMAVN